MSRRTSLFVAVVLCAQIVFVAHAARFMPYWVDDAYISFAYGKHLVEWGELIYRPDEMCEGYTNFLWVMLSAGAYAAFGQDGVLAAMQFLLLVCGLVLIPASALLARRLTAIGREIPLDETPDTPPPDTLRAAVEADWPAHATAIAIAATSAFAIYVNAGMETLLFLTLIVSGALTLARAFDDGRSVAPGLALFTLAALTRFDGFVPLGIAGACVAASTLTRFGHARHRENRAQVVMALGVAAAAWVAYFAWRWSYYGELAPNTYQAKMSAAYAANLRIVGGFAYLGQAVHGMQLYLPLAAAAYFAVALRARLSVVLPALLAGWHLFESVWVGGDMMPAYRFVLPAVPLVFAMGFAGLARAAQLPASINAAVADAPRTRAWPKIAAGVALALVAGVGQWVWFPFGEKFDAIQKERPGDRELYLRAFPVTGIGRWQNYYVGRNTWLARGHEAVARSFASLCTPERELATDLAGVFAYFTDCRVLDTWGLNSIEIARRGRAIYEDRYTTFGVVAPEVVLEHMPHFLLPYPPMFWLEHPMERATAIARIFPGDAFTGRPEMESYRVLTAAEDGKSYTFLVRNDTAKELRGE
ncbi:hypothetical protein K8I61_13535 [bacterium]|nr:hypothetical protein [bacterium]